LENIQHQITENIVNSVGSPPDVIQLVKPSTIPKTSSGKLRRGDAREAYLRTKFTQKTSAPAWQIGKIWLKSLIPRLKNSVIFIFKLLYNIYSYVVFTLTILLLWGMILVLPKNSEKIPTLVHYWASCLLTLVAVRPRVSGKPPLLHDKPAVFIANHASYLDVIVLAAVVPQELIYVAKKELLKMPVVGTVLKRRHHIMVDREDLSASCAEIEVIAQKLQAGKSVLLF